MPGRFLSTSGGLLPETRALRRLQITSSRLVTDIFAGEYRSAFRGRGIEFDEVREYQSGDDIRSIDWNVTARQGHPFIKRFVEERELTLLLLLDRSASMDFGTVRSTKLDTGVEACALLAFAALRSHDRMGLLTYGDGDISYLPPGKGKRHALQLIRTATTPASSCRQTTSLAEALDYFQRVVRGRALTCIFSDFIDPLPIRSLGAIASRHDTVAVAVSDPAEHELPDAGLLRLADAENGHVSLIDSSSQAVRDGFRQQAAQRQCERREAIRASGTDLLEISTRNPPLYPFMRFFQNRQQWMRR